MKPSHRKDVIIARVVFVVFIAAVIGIIVTVASHISNSRKNNQAVKQETEAAVSGDDTEAFISTESTTEEVITPIETITVYVKTTSSVNLRSEASTDGEKLALIPADTQLEMISEADGWTEVKYNDQTGFVSSDFVEHVESAEGTTGDGTDAGTTTTMTTTTSVNMRKGPSTDDEIVVLVPAGATVECSGLDSGWQKVIYNGQEGYIRADFLTE